MHAKHNLDFELHVPVYINWHEAIYIILQF